jgi:predicted naringenin-chalcone synthase
MSKILSLANQVPDHRYSQAELVAFMEQFITNEVDLRKLKFIGREAGIDHKYSVLSDFKLNGDAQLFKNVNESPTTDQRLSLYHIEAPKLAMSVSEKALAAAQLKADDITAIVTVSCTGIKAPGLEVELAERLGLPENIQRHSVNFMGCYAAFHGLRLADLICQSNAKAKVLVVCVELCSLHFKADGSDDNLLSTALFGDGASAAIVSESDSEKGLAELVGFQSTLIPEGKEDMSWNIGNHGFDMVLNRNVPKHIERNIARAFDNMLASQKWSRTDVQSFAIHPGGKNVLKAFANALQQEELALDPSYKILRDYGNMSSCTVLFVLEQILNQNKEQNIYAAAFGPGLTVESALIKSIV